MDEDPQDPDVTRLLGRSESGDSQAQEQLDSVLYQELHRMAAGAMRAERGDHTLQATALVNEAYIKLVTPQDQDWASQSHFFRRASHAMRQILIDHARGRGREKRGGEVRREGFTDSLLSQEGQSFEILDLHDALERLSDVDQRKALIAELHLFGGRTLSEIAKCLALGIATIKREWSLTRAWLKVKLNH